MVSKLDKLFLISWLSILLLIHPSKSSPVQNELLETLTIRLDNLQLKFDQLAAENSENVAKIDLLEAKNVKQEEEIIKLKTKINAKLESDMVFFDNKHVLHSTEFDSEHLRGPLNEEPILNTIENKLKTNLINRKENFSGDSSIIRATVPSSCRELSLIGHSLDGFYLVKNVDTNKIQTVYCEFGTSVLQGLVGNVEIKTTSAHFYVQRSSSFSTADAIIPWQSARLNEGGAMNLAVFTGVFTAPVDGIYHFEFTGVKDGASTALGIYLQVNGANVGWARTNQVTAESFDTVSFSASLRLKTNDRVNLFNDGIPIGELFENGIDHYIHFTGWLVEEDMHQL